MFIRINEKDIIKCRCLFLADENNDMSSTARPSSRSGKSFVSTVRSFASKVKDIMPTKPDPNNAVRTDPQLKYIFNRFTRDDEVNILMISVQLKFNILVILCSWSFKTIFS